MKNFLLIGVGPHARLFHLPTLWAGRSAGLVGTVTGVDVADAAGDIAAFNSAAGTPELPVTFIEHLPVLVSALLDTYYADRPPSPAHGRWWRRWPPG